MTSDIKQKQRVNRLNDSKVKTHPCYSKDAHQYARIHLPVAPACNIQCNYCNRKFDCSNESRPGVVSKLLSPAEAIHRFQTVKARMPELKVVGIAGPGDPLANPKATLTTLKGIKAIDEDVHLCISTNGLNLSRHIEALVDIGVHHLTITVNTLQPSIAANLYPWIYFNHQRYKGIEAAELLIEQQLKGLSLAAEAGILVKVNTVLVPGINDLGLEDLAKEIQLRGALLHNIMPLISDPSHGTFFGKNHIIGPTDLELEQARKVAGINMPQMSHCKQCRADAVGKLDADQSCHAKNNNLSHTNLLTTRVAVATQNGELIDTHFGYANQFNIYELSAERVNFIEVRSLDQYCSGKEQCDEQESNLSAHLDCLKDCQQVLCSRIGIGPWQTLEQHHIVPVIDYAMLGVNDALNIIRSNLNNTSAVNALKEVC
jgi:nitrogen fixation protein NifB